MFRALLVFRKKTCRILFRNSCEPWTMPRTVCDFVRGKSSSPATMNNSERGRTAFTRIRLICVRSCGGINVTKQKLSDKMHYDRCANVSVSMSLNRRLSHGKTNQYYFRPDWNRKTKSDYTCSRRDCFAII